MNFPAVSVVIPVFNAAADLEQTLAAVFTQSFCDFEVIAIDDGSTDGSLALLRRLAETDYRLRVVSQENRGVSAARNLGIELARAPLVAFLDADDIWARNKLARHMRLHGENPAASASYARIAFIESDANSISDARTFSTLGPEKPELTDVLAENPVCTMSNLVVRRDWLAVSGGFDTRLSYAEDQELIARLLLGGARVCGIDEVLVGYRMSHGGLSVDLERMHRGWRQVARRHLARDELPPFEAVYCRYLARRALRSGNRSGKAWHYVRTGLLLDAPAFLSEPRRALLTILGALAAPLIPPSMRQRIFA